MGKVFCIWNQVSCIKQSAASNQDEGHMILTKRTEFVLIKHPNIQTGAQRSMELQRNNRTAKQ